MQDWRFTSALVLGSLLNGQQAFAGSRFDLGEAVPVESRSRIDITIVIPEFVRLEASRSEGSAPVSRCQSKHFAKVCVVGNSDTIVIAVASGDAASLGVRDDEMHLTNVTNPTLWVSIP